MLGSAQTGTGKTAAFALPMLHKLAVNIPRGKRPIRALVLAPTRELALQIQESFNTYGRGIDLYHLVIFGGVNQNPQVQVAAAGRRHRRRHAGAADGFDGAGPRRPFAASSCSCSTRPTGMLDMGFIPDIRRIEAKLPKERQTLLFSATVPPSIKSLAASLLKNPVRVEIAPEAADRG